MARKKTKRFNEGGVSEDQLKAEGLAASKDDKVGFFERLRMGNIDAPDSEAYKRFGAGRGRAARSAVEKPMYDIGYEGRDAALATPAAPAAPMPAAQPVDPYEVRNDDGTLSKSRRNEYGELYDPTGESAAAPVKKPVKRPVAKPVAKPAAKTTESKPASESGKEKVVAPRSDYSNEGRGRARTSPFIEKIAPKIPYMPKEFDNSYPGSRFKSGGAVKKTAQKMASGGMTSKASSRGDGIAQRGKTRGKIC
jgi:hypothetical protein